MILWESALLGLFGGIVGVVLGVVGVNLMKNTPAIRGLLEPELSAGLMAHVRRHRGGSRRRQRPLPRVAQLAPDAEPRFARLIFTAGDRPLAESCHNPFIR